MASFEQAVRAMQAHEESLFDNPNVTYTSVVQRNDDGEVAEDFVVEVGLIEEEPEIGTAEADEELAFVESFEAARVPSELSIPPAAGVAEAAIESTEDTVSVVTDVSGEITLESFTGRRRPARGGNSCGNPRMRPVGTLGIAYQGQQGVFILSNWHVLYGGPGRDGDPIIQPGIGDGGRFPGDVIGANVKGWLDDYRDAAIARVRQPYGTYVAPGTRCYGPVAGLGIAVAGRDVKKCGRTTRATTGVIVSTAVTVRVGGYPGGSRVFRDQIQLSRMSAPGDSGSVIIDSGTNEIVGLLFAGGSTATFANKIERIFRVTGATATPGEELEGQSELDSPVFDFKS